MNEPGANEPLPAGRPIIVRTAGTATGCLVAASIALLCLCVISGLLNLILIAGSSGQAVSVEWTEEVIRSGGSDQVLVIEVDGVLYEGGQDLFGVPVESPAERLASQLERARTDRAKAVVLAIDSPGGTVTASDRCWRALREFRSDTSRPVVIAMGSICASGGYYLAAAGDCLVAEPTTITGSIGVIMQAFNFSGLCQEIGVQGVTITAGEEKDLLNPFEPVREGDRARVQEIVTSIHERFIDVVAQGRPSLGADGVRPLATGRVFTAQEALTAGLIDAIGYRSDAIDRAASLASIQNPTVIRYRRPPSLLEVLAGHPQASADPGVTLRLDPAFFDRLATPQFLYLWRP